jgi:O-antigen/teichoic acid export membrane protein
LAGLGVGLHIVAWVPFQLSLGLSQIGAWMSEQAWRQWVLLGLLLLLLPPLGLTGALVAVVLMEAIFCVLGFWWTRSYWRLPELRLDWHYLRPYLKFGLGFFLANLATVALYRSGPVLVETLTGQARQTGYLNLGLGLFLMVYITVSQFAQGLIPTLSRFQDQGQPNEVRKWLRKFATYGWLFGWLGTLVVWSTADWAVPRLFGAGYAPVAPVLKWISLGLPLTALLWAGNVTATVTRRGRLKFQASLAALATFLTATLWLTPVFLAVGSALALGLATLVNVVVLSWALRSDFAPNWTVLWQSATAAGLSLGMLVWLS